MVLSTLSTPVLCPVYVYFMINKMFNLANKRRGIGSGSDMKSVKHLTINYYDGINILGEKFLCNTFNNRRIYIIILLNKDNHFYSWKPPLISIPILIAGKTTMKIHGLHYSRYFIYNHLEENNSVSKLCTRHQPSHVLR